MLINKLLPLVMKDIGAIGKKHKNSQGAGYNFRSIEDALNFIQPVLIQHSISLSTNCRDIHHYQITEQVKVNKERQIYRTTLVMDVEFFAEDGSSRKFSSVGEGLDYGSDKASNKAMSAAFKYAMFLGLAIPIEAKQIDDSDRSPSPSASLDATPGAGDTPYSVSIDSPCSPEQRERIVATARVAKVPGPAIRKNLAARGMKSLSDLSVKQADILIAHLQEKTDGIPF